MKPTDALSFLVELAERADEIALRYFQSQDPMVREKPNLGPVTDADLQIEEEARKQTRNRFPDWGVFGEEEGEAAGTSATRLIIDPIDATRNFIRGIPVFATLLAVETDGEIVAGLVSAPALARRWTAAKGSGAYLGPRKLAVSQIQDLASAQLFHGSIGGVEAQSLPPGMQNLLQQTERQRGFGDFYQHCLVAEGAGEIAVDPIVSPWDIAPLKLLVEEAGGRCSSLGAENSIYRGSWISTNGLLHQPALQILRG